MSQVSEKRHFSHRLRDTNSAFLPARAAGNAPVRVGFVLLPHFSMMAFTAAVDALVTANLVQSTPCSPLPAMACTAPRCAVIWPSTFPPITPWKPCPWKGTTPSMWWWCAAVFAAICPSMRRCLAS
ncbi:hypothetical protein MBH78_18300 [Oceanimonas sp. NS1]|nr:hypothetical protein [Oceanimonas sp. NS1]